MKTLPWNVKLRYKVFLRKLKHEKNFDENEYGQLYPSGSALARNNGTPEMHKFSSSDSFPKLRLTILSIGTFNYNPPRFCCDFLSPVVPNDYSCNDTFSFAFQKKNVNLTGKFIVIFHFKKPLK